MGTTLTGLQIDASYSGLIKTGDNGAINATPKTLSDGLGNDACIAVGTTSTVFTGTADFTAATVTGLPAAAAGLESGTGVDSMQSAASLTTNPANAARDKSIALGDNASTGPDGTEQVAIGSNAKTFHDESVSIGANARSHYFGVAVGRDSDAGTISDKGGNIAIGNSSRADGFDSTIAIGSAATALLEDSVALGQGVTAGYTGTVSVKALETQTNSTPTAGGIIMSDAGGTDRRINIDATGALQIDSTPVGGGGAAGLVSGAGTDSLKNADSLVTTPAVAACPGSIALGNGATANPAFGTLGSIVIGCNASTARGGVVIIGGGATASDANSTVIGYSATGTNNHAIAVGYQTNSSSCAVAMGSAARATGAGSIAIGQTACAQNGCNIAIGCGSCTTANNSQAIGKFARAFGDSAQALGLNAAACNNYSISIGAGSIGNNVCSIALGFNARACANAAVAIGNAVTATTADTVSVKALETQTASTPTAGGIIMTDAGSTARRLNIDASGNLQIDSTPVGGGAAGLVSGTGTDSLKNDDSLVTLPATSSGNGSIALGNNSDSLCVNSIAIGGGSEANADRTVSIGSGAGDNQPATATNAINIGSTTKAYGLKSIQIGSGESNCSGAGFTGAISIGSGDGWGVEADADYAVAIGYGGNALGKQTSACGVSSIALGTSAFAKTTNDIAIGTCAATANGNSISIGCGATNLNSDRSIAIGKGSNVSGWSELIAIGCGACHVGNLYGGAAIGCGALAYGPGVAIGNQAKTGSFITSVAIGDRACATSNGSVALGTQVTASRADTVTGCQMEACVAGKGIVVTSPDGLTTLGIGIDNSGNIVTYTP